MPRIKCTCNILTPALPCLKKNVQKVFFCQTEPKQLIMSTKKWTNVDVMFLSNMTPSGIVRPSDVTIVHFFWRHYKLLNSVCCQFRLLDLICWSIRSSSKRGGDLSLFYPVGMISLLEYKKIWCNIQVIIYIDYLYNVHTHKILVQKVFYKNFCSILNTKVDNCEWGVIKSLELP